VAKAAYVELDDLKMKIGWKLISGYLAIAVFVAAVGIVSIVQLRKIARPLNEEIPKAITGVNEAARLDDLASQIRYYDEVLTQSARNYAFTQNQIWKQRYKDIEPKLEIVIAEAIEKGDEKDKQFFRSVDNANIALVKLEYASMKMVDSGRPEPAIEILEGDEYCLQKNAYARGLADYAERRGRQTAEAVDVSTKTIADVAERTGDIVDTSIVLIYVLLAVAVIFAVGMGLALSYSVTSPLKKLRTAALHIGRGQLDTQIDVDTKDELGQLAGAFRAMTHKLSTTTTSIHNLQDEIDRRKKLQEALSESDERYRELVEHVPDVIFTLDMNKSVTSVNKATNVVFGFEQEDIVGKAFSEWVVPEQLSDAIAVLDEVLAGKEIAAVETSLYDKKRDVHQVELVAARIVEAGQVVGLRGIIIDATDHKATQKALRQSEHKYKLVVEGAGQAIFNVGKDGLFHFMNTETAKQLGGKPEQFIGKTMWDLFPKEIADSQIGNISKIIESGEPGVFVQQTVVAGKQQWYEMRIRPVSDALGSTDSAICIANNITERKNAEELLQKSEQQYRALCQSIPGMVYTGRPDWSVEFISNSEVVCGYSEQQFYDGACNWLKMIHPDDKQRVLHESSNLEKEHASLVQMYRIIDKEGNTRWVEDHKSSLFGEEGVLRGFHGVVFDITERKNAEADLFQSEQRYRSLVENVDFGIILVDSDHNIVAINSAGSRLFKKSVNEIVGRKCYKEFEKRDHICSRCPGIKAMATREPHKVETSGTRDDGTRIDVRVQAFPVIERDGHASGFVEVVEDITEHKKAEHDVRESEARYRALFEGSNEGILVADGETKKFKYANPAMCRMLGYTEEELCDMGIFDIHHPDDIEHVVAEFEAQVRGEKTLAPSIPCLCKDGSIVYADVNAAHIQIDGQLCVVGFFTDITQRKKADEAVRISEEKYRRLVENLRAEYFFYSHDVNGVFIYISPSVTTVLGYPQQEFLTHYTEYLTDNPVNEEAVRHTDLSIAGIQQPPYELEIYHKDGTVHRLEVNEFPVFDENANVTAVEGIAHDITERIRSKQQLQDARDELEKRVQQRTADLARANEDLRNEIADRKRAEGALRDAEERFRTIFEDAVIGLYRTTPDGWMLMANPAMIKMLGFDSFEELSKVNLEDWPYDPSSPRSLFKEQMVRDGKVTGREAIWLRADGTKLFACESAVAIKDDDGKILYYEGSVEDITERKQAEEKLLMYQMQLRSLASELSLAEERLRRRIATDVHDHIGQNLAISKIKLDALRQLASSSELAGPLDEVSDLIAQAIKSSRSLTFDLSPPVLYDLGFEPALEWLVRDIRERHGLNADFETDGRGKPLEHDITVLLFQAVRELLVNVAKHAKAENVTVASRRKGDEVRISIKDDGVGFDASRISAQGSSTGGYGLFSIRERLGHVGGRLEIDSKPKKGTRITMVVKISSNV